MNVSLCIWRLSLISLVQGSQAKIAPMPFSELVLHSDLIVYVLPTSDRLKVNLAAIIYCKGKTPPTQLTLKDAAPPNPHLTEQIINYGVGVPTLIFLKRPAAGDTKWRPVSHYVGSIEIANGRTPARLGDVSDYRAPHPVWNYFVGNGIQCPRPLCKTNRGYATLNELKVSILKCYKTASPPANHKPKF